MSRRLLGGVLTLALLAGLGLGSWQLQQRRTVAHAQVSTTVAVAQQAADAPHRGGPAALEALFTDDAVFVGGQRCFPTACLGKPAVLQELAGEIAGHVNVTNTSLTVEGNIV